MLDHYGLRSSQIQPGKAHANGVVEQAHFRTKTALEQALLLRGGDEAALSGLRAGGRRRSAKYGGGGAAGRGAVVSAAVAVGSDPGVHDVPVRGAEVEHDPGRRADLFRAVAVDRPHGRGATASAPGLEGAGLPPGAPRRKIVNYAVDFAVLGRDPGADPRRSRAFRGG